MFQASVDFIETKGKGKKKYRHCVAEFEFAGVNIFEGPQYSVTVRKLRLEEMDDRQRNSHAIQKSVTTAYGIAKSVKRRLESISSLNPAVNESAANFCEAGRDLVEKVLPPANTVFGLKTGESIAYLN